MAYELAKALVRVGTDLGPAKNRTRYCQEPHLQNLQSTYDWGESTSRHCRRWFAWFRRRRGQVR